MQRADCITAACRRCTAFNCDALTRFVSPMGPADNRKSLNCVRNGVSGLGHDKVGNAGARAFENAQLAVDDGPGACRETACVDVGPSVRVRILGQAVTGQIPGSLASSILMNSSFFFGDMITLCSSTFIDPDLPTDVLLKVISS